MGDEMLRRSVEVPADVLVQELEDGEAVVLNTRTDRYYALNGVAARMWELVKQEETLSDALARLDAEYDTSPERLQHDLVEFVETLRGRGLIRLT